MARTATVGLFPRLVDEGLATFIRRGYRRTRIADVARAAGVAPGTVYLYVTGKEALFTLAVRVAFDEPNALDVETPYDVTNTGWTDLWAQLRARDPLGELRKALKRKPQVTPPADEWNRLLRLQWSWMSRHARALSLIEACADDWPELGLLYFQQFRRDALDLLSRYIAIRSAGGTFAAVRDPEVAARVVVEAMAWFTMHRHRDPDAAELAGRPFEDTVLPMLERAFQ
ncbi:MAG: TetR family transcriptional regulator [Gemmatimonadales bacterium]